MPKSVNDHPDGERDGLRRVMVDGAPLLTFARAGALHPPDGTLAALLGAARERLHEAVDRALPRSPSPRRCWRRSTSRRCGPVA